MTIPVAESALIVSFTKGVVAGLLGSLVSRPPVEGAVPSLVIPTDLNRCAPGLDHKRGEMFAAAKSIGLPWTARFSGVNYEITPPNRFRGSGTGFFSHIPAASCLL